MNFCVCRQQQICNSWEQICNFWQFITNRLYIIANLSPFNHILITRLIVDQFHLDAPKLLWSWQRLQVVADLEPVFKETISKATRFVSLVTQWFAASVFCSVTIALGHHPTFINKILARWHTFPVFHCWHQHQSVSCDENLPEDITAFVLWAYYYLKAKVKPLVRAHTTSAF